MVALLNSPWPFVIVWGWLALVIAASIVRRKRLGKPIFPKPPSDAVFVEKWTSGRSLKTFWSQIGGASNCLLVAITPTELVVTPQFPFNLMFLPEVYGLEFVVPRHSIRSIETRAGLFRKVIVVQAVDQTFELRLRDAAGFQRTLAVQP